MNVTMVPIVISALGTVTKGLLKGLEEISFGFITWFDSITFHGYLMLNSVYVYII